MWGISSRLVQRSTATARDPCRPWRATLDPGHKPRLGLFCPAVLLLSKFGYRLCPRGCFQNGLPQQSTGAALHPQSLGRVWIWWDAELQPHPAPQSNAGCLLGGQTPCFWGRDPQFSSVTESCLTLCNPMNCSTPGLPVHQGYLPGINQGLVLKTSPSFDCAGFE